MLFILFSVGEDRYAIAARQVMEVAPYARLKTMPRSHPALAGLLNFHGLPVPVIDTGLLLGNAPSPEALSTRILLCKGALPSAPDRLLGLLAANANEARPIAEAEFREPGARPPSEPYLGRVYEEADGRYIQWIIPSRILPDDIAGELLQATLAEG